MTGCDCFCSVRLSLFFVECELVMFDKVLNNNNFSAKPFIDPAPDILILTITVPFFLPQMDTVMIAFLAHALQSVYVCNHAII